jgi:uncharacterized protein YbaP (TraB family)
MRPWAVGMLVVQLEMKRMGFDPSYGLDQHFLDEARKSHKLMGALEEAGSQIKLLSSLSEEFQDRLLLNSLVDVEKWPDDVDLLTRASIGRPRHSEVRDYPQLAPLMTKLLDDRTTAMTAKIERFSANARKLFRRRRRRPSGRRQRHPEPIAAEEFQAGAALGSELTE